MALMSKLKSVFRKDEETTGVGSGNHDNYYRLTDEDRAKGEEVKRINREIKKRKALRDAYIEKLLDDKEIALIKSEIDSIHGDKENSDIDNVMLDTITKLLSNQNPGIEIPGITPTGQAQSVPEENFYADEIVTEANKGMEPPQEQEVESRFTDEEIEKNLPKLLNKTQMNYISQLSEEELLQVHDIIKKKKAL